MKRISTTSIFLLSKRAKTLKFFRSEGYTDAQLAIIFNIHKSTVGRIIAAEEKYKKYVKKMLSD
jgi:DNA-binding CsgD family transcriptional regulator